MESNYKGVRIPEEIVTAFDDATDPRVNYWKDGVDAALRSRTLNPAPSTEGDYRGVPVPGLLPGTNWDAWKAGVDAHYARTLELSAGRDRDGRTVSVHPADKPFLDSFSRVLADDPDRAREIVRSLSGRDKAVLSFALGELSRLVSEEEMARTENDWLASRRRTDLH